MRHGTTTLFAALDVLSGNVIGECRERHTSADYIKFLKKIDKACETGKTLHIVVRLTYIVSILQGVNHNNNFVPEAAPFPDGSFSPPHPKTVLPG